MITEVRIKLDQVIRASGETPYDESNIFEQLANELKISYFNDAKIAINWDQVLKYVANNNYWTQRLFGARSNAEFKKAAADIDKLIKKEKFCPDSFRYCWG